MIETPVGDANGKTLSVWFGKKDGNNCAHGMLAATTGAGKSNFYHALILGLARRYSPEELRMYLIDGKNGVEFEVYKSFPHAEVVSLKSSSELAGSILSELVAETKRRNDIFREAGVNSFEDYRSNPAHIMPRILLLIDEYQILFEADDAAEASRNLHSLTAQARSAGIHLLLGSQHFGAPNMLNKDIIFTNIQLFIAMKMTMDDRQSLTMFGREGKELIRKCEFPGQIVLNHNGGSDGYNQLGKVAFVGKSKKTEIINAMTRKAKEDHYDEAILRTIIFEGDSAPDMDANPELRGCLVSQVLTQEALQQRARIQERDGGFGKIDWNQSEKPMICWMGQEMNVYGQFSALIRRRKMENMLILGDRNPYRYGMLISTLFSLVATHKPEDIDFYIYDRSTVGTDWNPCLGMFASDVLQKNGYKVQFSTKVKDIKSGIVEVKSILNRRLALDQDERMDLKPVIMLITEPEEIEDLNLVTDKNGFKTNSESGSDLEFIYTNGSSAGVHVILSSSGVIPLLNVLQKRQLSHFRHRISLQISEQESFDLFGARIGAQLQKHGDVPVLACYKDINGNFQIKFKPYSVTDKGYYNQFDNLKQLVYGRTVSCNAEGTNQL
ncbi:MAG: FtsK/SpoIIIE domain-containing protein [Candidatus Cryptobacteroides sp.]